MDPQPQAAAAADPRAVRAWCLYDWANSAFATTVMAALMPPFFRVLAEQGGMGPAAATAAWAYTTAVALLVVAVAAPLAGAVADALGRRRRLLGALALTGAVATVALAVPGRGQWPLAAGLYVAANVAFALSIVFYESLLPHVAPPEQLDRVSARGYAYGYAGGGLLLLLNALWVARPGWFGLPDQGWAVRAALASAGLWWGLFTLPLLRRLPEPPAARGGSGRRAGAAGGRTVAGVAAGPAAGRPRAGEVGGAGGAGPVPPPRTAAALADGLGRLATTIRRLRRHRQVALFLLAYWLYNDGIGTIVKLATAYGHELGIGMPHLVGALLLTQAIGVPGALLMGRLAGRSGPRPVLLGGLAVYAGISIGAFFLRTTLHFYLLAAAVGLVQGGTQALSRSLFAALSPRDRAAEFFGFYGASGRIAGIVGPLVFAVVGGLTGQSRLGILALLLFFLGGGALLLRVDVAEGVAQARRLEREGGLAGAGP